MTRPTGLHHLAISTGDMKAQLTFFTEVLGMELFALYWMHGVEGAWHGFLRLNDRSSLAFVHMPGVREATIIEGASHAIHAGGPSAPGTMQHVALRVDTDDELFAIRDRIRSHGVPVFGPVDHGDMCKSIYFAGPEGLNLEVAASERALDPNAWIDPEVVGLAGISPDELQRMTAPPAFNRPAQPVAQPPYDPDKPHLKYPPEVYARMLALSDETMAERSDFTQAPVATAQHL